MPLPSKIRSNSRDESPRTRNSDESKSEDEGGMGSGPAMEFSPTPTRGRIGSVARSLLARQRAALQASAATGSNAGALPLASKSPAPVLDKNGNIKRGSATPHAFRSPNRRSSGNGSSSPRVQQLRGSSGAQREARARAELEANSFNETTERMKAALQQVENDIEKATDSTHPSDPKVLLELPVSELAEIAIYSGWLWKEGEGNRTLMRFKRRWFTLVLFERRYYLLYSDHERSHRANGLIPLVPGAFSVGDPKAKRPDYPHAMRISVNERLTKMDLATRHYATTQPAKRSSGLFSRRKSLDVSIVQFRSKYIVAADTCEDKDAWMRFFTRASSAHPTPRGVASPHRKTPRSTRVMSPSRSFGLLSPRDVLADETMDMLQGFDSVEGVVDALENQLHEEYDTPSSMTMVFITAIRAALFEGLPATHELAAGAREVAQGELPTVETLQDKLDRLLAAGPAPEHAIEVCAALNEYDLLELEDRPVQLTVAARTLRGFSLSEASEPI